MFGWLTPCSSAALAFVREDGGEAERGNGDEMRSFHRERAGMPEGDSRKMSRCCCNTMTSKINSELKAVMRRYDPSSLAAGLCYCFKSSVKW